MYWLSEWIVYLYNLLVFGEPDLGVRVDDTDVHFLSAFDDLHTILTSNSASNDTSMSAVLHHENFQFLES